MTHPVTLILVGAALIFTAAFVFVGTIDYRTAALFLSVAYVPPLVLAALSREPRVVAQGTAFYLSIVLLLFFLFVVMRVLSS